VVDACRCQADARAVAARATDLALEATGVLPSGKLFDTGLLLLATAYRIVLVCSPATSSPAWRLITRCATPLLMLTPVHECQRVAHRVIRRQRATM